MKTRYLRLVKKQRGFTLIELLAVILILGIIALIAIPTVTSVVEQSRKGSAESSANQFVVAVNELIVTTDLVGEKLPDGLYTAEELQTKGLSIKGTMPDSGVVLIEDSEVVACNFNYGNYNVICNDKETNVIKTDEKESLKLTEDNDSNDTLSIGDKVCIDTECFYVISITSDSVRMLAEWNLNVGYNLSFKEGQIPVANLTDDFNEDIGKTYKEIQYTKSNIKNYEIKQNSEYKGWFSDVSVSENMGVISFSYISKANYDKGLLNGYWVDSSNNILSKYKSSNTYPAYVYDDNSYLYNYVNYYINNLKVKYSLEGITGNLIKYEELVSLGCTDVYVGDFSNTCKESYSWISNTSFWTGSASSEHYVWFVFENGSFHNNEYFFPSYRGVRPVITISKDLIK